MGAEEHPNPSPPIPNSITLGCPSPQVSTPPGSARVFYTNERANERKIDLSKISRDRPTPNNSIGQKKGLFTLRAHCYLFVCYVLYFKLHSEYIMQYDIT